MAVPMSTLTPLISFPEAQFYQLNFYGHEIRVCVTSHPYVAHLWVENTRRNYINLLQHPNQLVAGFGVEWVGTGPASILQICLGRRCLIFQVERAPFVPLSLRNFINSVRLVGIRNQPDAWMLWMSRHRVVLNIGQLLDLRYFVHRQNGTSLIDASFEEIVNESLSFDGVNLENWVTPSDWNVEVLGMQQVSQAAVDALASFLIGTNIHAWTFDIPYPHACYVRTDYCHNYWFLN